METKENISRPNQRLHPWWKRFVLSSDKLVHKRSFWVILLAALVFGLVLAFLFAEMPIAGENYPIPVYP
jgi:hypothetical protein